MQHGVQRSGHAVTKEDASPQAGEIDRYYCASLALRLGRTQVLLLASALDHPLQLVQSGLVERTHGVSGSSVRRSLKALCQRGLVEWEGRIDAAEVNVRFWGPGLGPRRAFYRLTRTGVDVIAWVLMAEQRAEVERLRSGDTAVTPEPGSRGTPGGRGGT
jgi:hypothetical protein